MTIQPMSPVLPVVAEPPERGPLEAIYQRFVAAGAAMEVRVTDPPEAHMAAERAIKAYSNSCYEDMGVLLASIFTMADTGDRYKLFLLDLATRASQGDVDKILDLLKIRELPKKENQVAPA